MDFINRIVQVLKEDLYWIRISAQNTGLMELVELQDKGQLSYMTSYEPYTECTYILTYLYTECTGVLKYWAITIGRSYIFKYTVFTIRQFSSLQ